MAALLGEDSQFYNLETLGLPNPKRNQGERKNAVSFPMQGGTMAAMSQPELRELTERLPRLAPEADKLQTRLCRLAGQAIADYTMIAEGDKVMVCLSGGKDSYGLLDVLLALRRRAPIRFELVAVNLDQKQPGFPAHVLPEYLSRLGVPFHIEERDTYSIVKRLIPEGRTTCSLCSRLRRGHLYRVAADLGATKIALGHHRDDLVETLLLNMLYGGKLKTMPPKLRSKDRRHIVIRPLAYVAEADLGRYAELRGFPIIPCDLCGSQENLKRKAVKALLRDWEHRFPGSIESLFASLSNVLPAHLLDRRLFDFAALQASDLSEDDDE
jgi:tRNA 2-thiocytidine biosynthesis protein TtcA